MRRRNKRPNMSPIRDVMKELGFGPVSMYLGLVQEDGDGDHWDVIDGKDIVVIVELVPEDIEIPCRVASFAGGDAKGCWSIPDVGQEVLVAIPSGELESGGVIIATLGDPPSDVDSTQKIVRMANNILDIATNLVQRADAIKLGSENASEQVVLGTTFKDDLDKALVLGNTTVNPLAVGILAAATTLAGGSGTPAEIIAFGASLVQSLGFAPAATGGYANGINNHLSDKVKAE